MNTIDALTLTQDLIRRRSITPADDGAQQVLIDALTPFGFVCETLTYGDVVNLFARRGAAGPHFCFCGHTDVVPPGDESAWKFSPFAGTVADGKLYGRGTSDMKANIAAFAAATARFLNARQDFNGSISFLITGDEEGPAVDGTVRVLDWMKAHGHIPDAFLVGEPSNPQAMGDEIRIGRRGSLNGIISVRGVQGHAAYPERADNPLPRLIKLLAALDSHVFDAGSDHFPPTNLEITAIETGNPAFNVIPAGAFARFNVRFNDRWTAQTLEANIRRVLDTAGVPYQMETFSNAAPFLTRPGTFTDMVARAVRDITGRMPKMTTGGGTSDARFVAAYGPVAECGLVNQTIHQVDEHVALADLETLTAIYVRVLELYFE